METKRKYSLRKFKVGVASVLVGLGVATTGSVIVHASDAETTQPAASQPAETGNTNASGNTETPKSEVTSPEIKQAEADAKKAEEKLLKLKQK